MIQTIKNRKRGSNLPISIGAVLKIGFAVAGFALWGWSFVAVVAVVAGAWVFFRILKGLLSLLLYLLIIAVIITLLVVIIF